MIYIRMKEFQKVKLDFMIDCDIKYCMGKDTMEEEE